MICVVCRNYPRYGLDNVWDLTLYQAETLIKYLDIEQRAQNGESSNSPKKFSGGTKLNSFADLKSFVDQARKNEGV